MTSEWQRVAAMTLMASAWLISSACSRDEPAPDEFANESSDHDDTAAPGDEADDDPPSADPGTHVFDTSRVATIALEVSDEALAILRTDADRAFNTEDFTYVPARMTFDGEVYEEVGLRVKGNSSRAMAQGDALPFKVDMNRYRAGQRLDGLTKINLHNNVNQPAAMNEYLSYGAFREFGIAASRTGWADVTLNDEPLGLYTLVEQVNDKMLGRWYEDGDVELYKPEPPAGSLSYLGDTIESYTNVGYEADNETDHATFLRLVQSLSEAEASSWDDVIDVESVLSYFAGNVALGNWDTYVAMGHNYYLFEATPGRMVMLPWDMNLSQGAATSICPTELRNGIGPGGPAGGFGGMGFDPRSMPTPPEGFVPPEGGFAPPPEGGFAPPEGGFMIPGGGAVPAMGGAGGFPGGGVGGFPGGGGAPLHDRLMADATYFSRYVEVLRSFLAGPGSVAALHGRIDAAVDVLGDRISSDGVSRLRDTIASRVEALAGGLERTTSCPLAAGDTVQ